jgi:hypothetical protein
MREVGLVVNDVPKIDTKRRDLNNKTHCIVANADGNGMDLRIPLQLDGIFSCFQTCKLTDDEINNCEYIPTIWLTPNSAE